MALRAKSIPVADVAKRAKEAAQSVAAERLKSLGGRPEIGFFPDIGTIGIILRDPDFGRLGTGELLEVAERITGAMGPLAEGADPMVNIVKGGITMGYFPSAPILFDQAF